MAINELLGLFLAILFGWYLYQKFKLFKKMAPGPFGVPILGSLVHLMRNDAATEFQKYRKQYGKVFSLGVGNYYVTVVTDHRLVVDSLKKDELQGRPQGDFLKMRNDGYQNRGVLFCDGPAHNEQRRYALRSLRDFGFGKESMDGMLIHEMQQLQEVLRKDLGQPVSLSGVFNASVLNSLWYIVTGKRFELDDPKLKELIKLLIDNIRGQPILTPGQYFYAPVKYGLIGKEMFQNIKYFLSQIKGLIQEVIDEHWEAHAEGELNDFIDAYIEQIKESSSQSTFYGDEGKKNLRALLLDLFVAGAETTSTTMQWAMLYLSHNPNVQKKAQKEIDNVIGRGRPPSRSDKPNMPYIEAVLNEVHRVASLIPYNAPHRATKDSEVGGYFIPKDSVVLFSIIDAHNDKETWGDPEVFRPERFLDKDGKVFKNEALIPFSSGKRQCLGETMARDTLFMFLTGLLQAFTFAIDPACANKELKGSRSFVRAPETFQVIIKERK